MKFGKYLAKRQLDLPEYADYFIDYKALKKVIKSLSALSPRTLNSASHNEIEQSLQENKATFFFRLERELEKVNNFYLQKEKELKVRIDILCEKKQNAYKNGELISKSSVSYISLHEGFIRFRRDLERLEQFIELNGTGFSKVLKKWDKRSKSHTKELYLTRAVEIQPVFHRDILANFSDLANSSILELEAWTEGDNVMFDSNKPRTTADGEIRVDSRRDDLYHEFYRTATSSALDEVKRKTAIEQWISQLKFTENARERITKLFLLTISTQAPDFALLALYYSGCVDLHAVDEISGKNCVHRAAAAGRRVVIDLALKNDVDFNKIDAYGKNPLHYACISNQRQLIPIFVEKGTDINALDQDNYSPLLYSIMKGFTGCVQDLLASGVKVDVDSVKDFIPLNFACKYGHYDIVELLLTRDPTLIRVDAEGLYPIHVIARAGHHKLVPLLKSFQVDLDQLDKFNGWTALCYGCSEGHVETVKALIEAEADVNALDEDGFSALYYACWEGHVDCVALLAKHMNTGTSEFPIDPSEKSTHGFAAENNNVDYNNPENIDDVDISDIDKIPDFSLPPPIIPVQRYGHSFLDKKIVVQLSFDASLNPIKFYENTGSSILPAGRLTISARHTSDIIPRSIILPFSDTDRSLTFQVESLEDFAIDYEIFPTVGTQIIAKSAALPYVFNNAVSQDSYVSEHYCGLPLLDKRLKAVGEISFRFQIVKPFQGKPLEITKYDTYWKSTSQVEKSNVAQQVSSQSLSFVTASSLSGEYGRIYVCLTRDRVPVVATKWAVTVNQYAEVEIAIGSLELDRLMTVVDSRQPSRHQLHQELQQVKNAQDLNNVLGQGSVILPLVEVLNNLPVSIKLDVGVLYPTSTDAAYSNLGSMSFAELNIYVDRILRTFFDHARHVRHLAQEQGQFGAASSHSRSIIFTSSHPDICTVLNWKQPNYPVFFNLNGLKVDKSTFEYQSAHGFPVEEKDRRCVSIKEAANFASNNNLLGIICDARLLKMVPSLIEAVRALGLVLVTNSYNNENISDEAHLLQGVDGFRTPTALTFKDSIDV